MQEKHIIEVYIFEIRAVCMIQRQKQDQAERSARYYPLRFF